MIEVGFCKMDVGPIFFQEICFTISWKNWPNLCFINCLQFGKEKNCEADFFFPK
jgi:hypothetical protein